MELGHDDQPALLRARHERGTAGARTFSFSSHRKAWASSSSPWARSTYMFARDAQVPHPHPPSLLHSLHNFAPRFPQYATDPLGVAASWATQSLHTVSALHCTTLTIAGLMRLPPTKFSFKLNSNLSSSAPLSFSHSHITPQDHGAQAKHQGDAQQ